MTDIEILGLTYLITVNIAGAVIALSDKLKAKKGKWRTPEKSFLILALIGGGAGVLIGFLLFRHKTRHGGLMAGVVALTLLFWGAFTAAVFLLS